LICFGCWLLNLRQAFGQWNGVADIVADEVDARVQQRLLDVRIVAFDHTLRRMLARANELESDEADAERKTCDTKAELDLLLQTRSPPTTMRRVTDEVL